MDAAVRQRIKIARGKFIDSIDPLAICQLASSYNDGQSSSIFEKPIAGSFNICYPVAFSLRCNSEIQKWFAFRCRHVLPCRREVTVWGCYNEIRGCQLHLKFDCAISPLTISNNASGWAFDIPRRPMPIELNAQELEGPQAGDIMKKDTIFKSAANHFTSLLEIAFNMFANCKDSIAWNDQRNFWHAIRAIERWCKGSSYIGRSAWKSWDS